MSLALVYIGVVLVFTHDLNLGGNNVWLGSGLVFASAVSYGIYLLASDELTKRVGPMRLVAYTMCVSTAARIVQFLVLWPVLALVLSRQMCGLLTINSVFCMAAPITMVTTAVARVGAPVASQADMIGPVSTLSLGWWSLGEPITIW